MISPLAAALYCASALCLAEGMFHQLSASDRRPPNPQRAFSLSLYAMAVQCFGSALLTDAADLAGGMWGQRLQFVGQAVALAAFLDFQQLMSQNESPRTIWGMRAFAASTVVIAASGLMVDPDAPMGVARFSMPFAVAYEQAPLSPLGLSVVIAAMLAVGRGLWKVRLAGLRNVEQLLSPALFASMVITLVAVGHDLLVRVGLLRSVYLMDFTVMVATLISSTNVVRRFVREGDALRQRTRELEHTYWELTEARDRLVHTRRLAAIGDLSAALAHEVRNPLAVIKNAGAALRRRDTLRPETQQELLGIIAEEVERLTRLTTDMLTYAKPLHLEPASHCPLELFRAAIARAQAEPVASRGVAIESQDAWPDTQGDGLRLVADGRLLVVALGHLISNALWAAPVDGRVTALVRLRESDGVLELTVRDDGPGMDAATREKATEPFFSTRPRGTGLGLSIAKRVAEAHGGTLQLASRPDRGTEATMRLPLSACRSSALGAPDPRTADRQAGLRRSAV